MSLDDLTEQVIGCAIAVHSALGPGLLESIYRDCLVVELVSDGLYVEVERRIPIVYHDEKVRHDLKLDILVNGQLVIEVKAVERLHPVHQAQVITYLRLSGFPAGLLLNFNAMTLRAGLHRLDHPTLYAAKKRARAAPR